MDRWTEYVWSFFPKSSVMLLDDPSCAQEDTAPSSSGDFGGLLERDRDLDSLFDTGGGLRERERDLERERDRDTDDDLDLDLRADLDLEVERERERVRDRDLERL
jgi:hypothetical protein